MEMSFKPGLALREHVAQKGNKYYIVVDMRDEVTNKRRRKWISGPNGGFDKKRDAERGLPEILNSLNNETFGRTYEEIFWGDHGDLASR
ncbi:AP2-like DNA-binding integrase domain-containing protein [Paenibacillus sp. cl141a]|uniref:Arm DNA-binding domain-containing protein n=1 Tax=Paenibacillus sp. cl141a TaxID=1761877 RepID=UPI0008D341B6|nr:Arm DNA-binding domain-containing protein [Paenibacillus sp. cl141a]SEL43808.1 AP2-like DNA-binding integrase domain-containing protein [Paenibacillus sp. cl141a]